MSNPWKRDTTANVPVPVRYQELDGRALAARCKGDWEIAAEDPIDPSSFMTTALRLRHGARAACKRLREERDEAVIAARELEKDLDAAREWIDVASRTLAKVVEEGPKIDAQTRELAAEADAARLELRALEWIMNESAFENSLVWRRKGRLWTGDDVEHESYASAARALGWEG